MSSARPSGVTACWTDLPVRRVEFLATHPVEVRAASEIAAHHRTRTGARLEEIRPEPMAARTGMIDLLERGQRSGELRAFDAPAMFVALRHAIDGAIAELERDPHFDAEAYARELATVFDLAIRPLPAAPGDT